MDGVDAAILGAMFARIGVWTAGVFVVVGLATMLANPVIFGLVVASMVFSIAVDYYLNKQKKKEQFLQELPNTYEANENKFEIANKFYSNLQKRDEIRIAREKQAVPCQDSSFTESKESKAQGLPLASSQYYLPQGAKNLHRNESFLPVEQGQGLVLRSTT
jgi:flagellar biosynthesis component FlhA